ncbi:hypothetical protein FB45DRAFT_1025693 [Roridomyces roridus]|uniref:Uncharacterized protein n=1 Tax=Roridomyces roridus TaxID=1738132 RepID=A0AAD7BZ63_9AGAR|nr:hypothetical protein FB45DRAFT_1025693 [Roridomyces roridus]
MTKSEYKPDSPTEAIETTSADAPAENQNATSQLEPRQDLEPTKTPTKHALEIGPDEEEEEFEEDLLDAPNPPKDVPRGKVTPSVGGPQQGGRPKPSGSGR